MLINEVKSSFQNSARKAGFDSISTYQENKNLNLLGEKNVNGGIIRLKITLVSNKDSMVITSFLVTDHQNKGLQILTGREFLDSLYKKMPRDSDKTNSSPFIRLLSGVDLETLFIAYDKEAYALKRATLFS